MVEGQESFPEFERLLEKEYPSVYQEEWEHEPALFIGLFLIFLSSFPFLFLGISSGIIQVLGLLLSFLGTIIFFFGLVSHERKRRKYLFRGLSRKTISEAIMFIDALLARPEDLDSPAPYHDQAPIKSYEVVIRKPAFILLVKSTAGLVTWPSDRIDEITAELREKEKRVPALLVFLTIVISIMLFIAIFWLVASGNPGFLVLVLIPILCLFQLAYYIINPLYRSYFLFKGNWLQQVRTSESISLEESLEETIALLQTDYIYPLRFYLLKEYPVLKYTGRKKTGYTLIRFKEAVLYPAISTQNEMPL
jgi:hypothetical protein